MLKVKSMGGKQDLGLTVSRATTQARKIVDAVMPGVFATADSRSTWDIATDQQVIVTTVTFPRNELRGYSLYTALLALPGQLASIRVGSASYVITRKVK